jgi:Carboxypeptidase regulatory-like domain
MRQWNMRHPVKGGIFLLLTTQILLAQGPYPASVQGIAIIAGSEDPVTNAVVELRPTGNTPTSDPILAATQSNGTFLFRAVPPGRYLVIATRNGYLPAEAAQRTATGRGIPITLAPGQQATGLRIAMTPTASISGRILDRTGQPMPAVVVQLLRPEFQNGRRMLNVMKSMLTNDLGEYRMFWIPPGSYYVNVIPPPDVPQPASLLIINPSGQPTGRSLWVNPAFATASPTGNGLPETETYLPVFFPGTLEESLATSIDLQPGADVRGIDIRVASIRASRVTGVVLDGNSRQPMPRIGLQLISLGPTPRTLQANSDAMGRYVIPRVPPGPYLLTGLVPQAGLGRLMPVEVREADIEANIELQSLFSISGRVAAPNPAAFNVRLRLDYAIPNAPAINVTPAADGSFTIRNIPAGDYRVFVAPILLPQGPTPVNLPAALQTTYVKAIRMGDNDLLNGRLRVDRSIESQIEINISTDAGSLAGHVLDDRQAPVPGATVVLLPTIERRLLRFDLYKTTSTDEGGRFLLEGVPPGDYRVFSWASVPDLAWQDPAFIRDYEERGRAVRITERKQENVEVTSLP